MSGILPLLQLSDLDVAPAGASGGWSTWRALRCLLWAKAEELEEAEVALAAVGLAHELKQPTTILR